MGGRQSPICRHRGVTTARRRSSKSKRRSRAALVGKRAKSAGVGQGPHEPPADARRPAAAATAAGDASGLDRPFDVGARWCHRQHRAADHRRRASHGPGELRGYRRVFIGGLAVFTLGSLACALSGSLTTLVASRILQGFGGAGIMSVNTALLRFIYPADQLGRGIGINALVGSISAAIGPSVAAGILSIASWQWLFAINVPLGVVALMFARRELPRTPLARHRFDWLSAGLSAATFGALIIGIDNLRRLSMAVAFELAGAAVAGALFIWRQRMLAYPMLALELFARPVFALSVVGSICSFTAQNLTFVSLPFFLEEVLGRSAVETGLLMTPWPMAVGFTAPIAGWLADRRYPAGILGGIGLAVLS